MQRPPETLHEYCRSILESSDLAAKLRPPRAPDGAPLVDGPPARPLFIDAPARSGALVMTARPERLPKLRALEDGSARAVCLERFAHHELLAVEMFAWALLAFPELPTPLRRGLLRALADEQVHLGLYLERLAAHGHALGSFGLSDYLWRHLAAVQQSANPPLAFLCALGLTFEQANLDYSLLYRDAFRQVGDEESARVMQRVHDDEVRHVRFALSALRRLRNPAHSDVETYDSFVPFPLSAARAKARRFDVAARRRAGFDEDFIAHVRAAKPSHQARSAHEPTPE